ncbi:MAG: hypothetical protein H2174_09555 [Vampirovibrio sp.]|nr:hypothetical protein [Vampirovibrio sp.]
MMMSSATMNALGNANIVNTDAFTLFDTPFSPPDNKLTESIIGNIYYTRKKSLFHQEEFQHVGNLSDIKNLALPLEYEAVTLPTATVLTQHSLDCMQQTMTNRLLDVSLLRKANYSAKVSVNGVKLIRLTNKAQLLTVLMQHYHQTRQDVIWDTVRAFSQQLLDGKTRGLVIVEQAIMVDSFTIELQSEAETSAQAELTALPIASVVVSPTVKVAKEGKGCYTLTASLPTFIAYDYEDLGRYLFTTGCLMNS